MSKKITMLEFVELYHEEANKKFIKNLKRLGGACDGDISNILLGSDRDTALKLSVDPKYDLLTIDRLPYQFLDPDLWSEDLVIEDCPCVDFLSNAIFNEIMHREDIVEIKFQKT